METYILFIYSSITVWTVFSLFYSVRIWRKGLSSVNLYVYESIPGIFTTFGILGTFLGIYFGLQTFDVNNINDSIPSLLEGLKTAFSTSIIGIILSLVFGKVIQISFYHAEKKNPIVPTDELDALQKINLNITETNTATQTNLLRLNESLIGKTDYSITTQLLLLNQKFNAFEENQSIQHNTLLDIKQILGGNDEFS
ncbi:MAG: MotA/TolQ/ExbB proton channel family protein, partial [Crocinitomicaceae bacterium]